MTIPISDCWSLNPLHCPKFENIYERLIKLKRKFIVEIVQAKTLNFSASKDKSYQIIEVQQLYDRFPLVSVISKCTVYIY